MDPSFSADVPADSTSTGRRLPSMDQPIPLFPTMWTPKSNNLPTVAQPSISHEGRLDIGPFENRTGVAPPQPKDTPSTTSSSSSGPRVRRRNRMITSCLECRRRKLKCDRLHPCSSCSKSKRDCLFLAPATDASSRLKLIELKEKIGHLERGLERDEAARQGILKERDPAELSGEVGGSSSHHPDGIVDTVVKEDSRLPIPDDEKDLEPTPLAVQDAAYEDEADDESYDLGFRLGKMRMTDRIGGFYRPRIADELSASLDMLHISDAPPQMVAAAALGSKLSKKISEEDHSYFDPSPSYVAPHSNMLLGCAQPHVLADFLPTRLAADRLLQQYWDAVHPIAKVVHRPMFEAQYREFWAAVSKGIEPPFSLQAIVFAALFGAVVSMSEDTIANTFGVSQRILLDNFQQGTETALGKARFLKTTKTQTLQALVMYMIPMCREEISRAHSVLVGTAIRLAECMGFHRDPEEYGLGPVECHIRRTIWYQLCFLDIHTSLLQGPRNSIRREDFSTKFPLNLDDTEIATAAPGPLIDAPRWTDMTFMRIRFECNELHRLLLVDRIRVEKKQVSITQVLGKIETFRKATYAKYGPLIYVPNPKPIQRAAQLVLSIRLCRAYISVLHRYANSVTVRIPDRLSQIIMSSGTQMLEDSMTLETSPELRPWAWYQGTFNQYHVALLLLLEIWVSPKRREADRIWRCLDYVFEISSLAPSLAAEIGSQDILQQREAKARLIISVLRDRMMAYREMRKLKIPRSMIESKLLPPLQEGGETCLASFGAENTSPVRLGSYPIQNKDESFSAPGQATPTSTRQLNEQFGNSLGLDQSAIAQLSTPLAQTSYSGVPASTQSTVQSLEQLPLSITDPLQQPSEFLPASTPAAMRASSYDSSQAQSDDSGSTLWFVSGTGLAGAGAAPPIGSHGANDMTVMPQNADSMDFDIDWNEWDKLFPINSNGEMGLFPRGNFG